jgi:hypothetical protein
MSVSSNASRFGKREIHQVWAERARDSVLVWLSPLRGVTAAAVFAVLAIAAALTAGALLLGTGPAYLAVLPRAVSLVHYG